MDAISLIHIPIAMLDTLTLALFFRRFLGRKFGSTSLYAIVYIAYFLLNTALSIYFPGLIVYYSLACNFVISFILYSGTKMQRVFCSGLLTAYLFVSEILTMIAFSFIYGVAPAINAASPVWYYSGAFVSKVMAMAITLLVSSRRKTELSATPYYYYIHLLIITYGCVGLSFFDFILVGQSGDPATVFHLLSEVVIAALSVLVFFVFRKFQEYAERDAYTASMERQLTRDEQMFRAMDDQTSEIRNIKHDAANVLTSIREMSARKKYDELDRYLGQVIQTNIDILSQSFTGIPSIDALLSQKVSVAESEGIIATINVGALPMLTINPVHLNMIFGNALDNAIEACRKLPEGAARYITLNIEAVRDWLYLRAVNSSLPVKFGSGGLPATDKADKLHHGLGLNIVKRLSERYGGTLLCDYEDGKFTLMAQIRQDD